MPNITPALERAGSWFLHSGIQEPQGGVARYYRSDLAKNATVSTEITGYSVSFLVYLYELSGSQEYLDAAERAARFLTRNAWSAALGLFPFEHSFNGSQPRPLAFFFDSGIIVRGLLAIWRVTRDPEYLDTAVAAGRGMLAHFEGPASIHPILHLPERSALPYEPRWSASPGCYQLKSAMAWHDLFEVTGEPEFRMAYERCLQTSRNTHQHYLPGDPNREKVMDRLHPYVYFLEGLLPSAALPESKNALRTGLRSVPEYVNSIAPMFARSDVYAQLLRMQLFAADLKIEPLDCAQAKRELDEIAKFQLDSDDPRLDGGFTFGIKDGEKMPYANPVSTAFCAQAIELEQRLRAGRAMPPSHALV